MIFNYLNKLAYIFPSKSLIKNIGFDGSGVNSNATFIFNTKNSPSKKINFLNLNNSKSKKLKQIEILEKNV